MVNLLLLLLLTRIWFNVRSRVVTNLLVWLGDRNKNKELKKLFFYWCLLVVIMISTPSYCNFLLHLFNSLCHLQNETLILWAYPNKPVKFLYNTAQSSCDRCRNTDAVCSTQPNFVLQLLFSNLYVHKTESLSISEWKNLEDSKSCKKYL